MYNNEFSDLVTTGSLDKVIRSFKSAKLLVRFSESGIRLIN